MFCSSHQVKSQEVWLSLGAKSNWLREGNGWETNFFKWLRIQYNVEVVIRLLWKKQHAVGSDKMTATNSVQHQVTTKSSHWSAAVCHTVHILIYNKVGGHRPDVLQMDHAGVLDSELNRYLRCSALWSLLMTSRWLSSIFKTPLSTGEAVVIRFLSLALMKYHLAECRESRRKSIRVRRTLQSTICGDTPQIPMADFHVLKDAESC